jgi:hypothetical protein
VGLAVTDTRFVIGLCDVSEVPIRVGCSLGISKGMGQVVTGMAASIYFEGPGVTGLRESEEFPDDDE